MWSYIWMKHARKKQLDSRMKNVNELHGRKTRTNCLDGKLGRNAWPEMAGGDSDQKTRALSR